MASLGVEMEVIALIAIILCTSFAQALSRIEEENIERQLKLLRKPAIKTIKTKFGDLYDCVDFYKQPAFDHPSLKNHTFHFQMKPSYYRKEVKKTIKGGNRQRNKWAKTLWANGKGCPYGTIPIRRTTREDLHREMLRLKVIHNSRINPLTAGNDGVHYALVQTRPSPIAKYTGVGAFMTIWNVPVTGSQYSAAQIKIQNGNEYLQTGWRVDPTLNGDNKTRTFIYTHVGQSQCYNTRCPGFVLVRQDMPIDVTLPISKGGGPMYSIQLTISQDPITKNWWLARGSDNPTYVGFWPRSLFTSLQGMAPYVNWGGEVFSPPGEPSPRMGAGYPLRLWGKYDAQMFLVTYRNETNNIINAINTQEFADTRKYYDVKDFGIDYSEIQKIGHLLLYGGPGGIRN
ncbi:Neprosin [Dillenia turbinata]|uniref:Neprosin n=1 Tax=Dillenia turbinata TaxID=194707 RepID=A0AAN8VSH6_9MAGN